MSDGTASGALARDAAIARSWLLGWAEDVAGRRTWLTELDAAIGDGDHGINLHRGLAAVAADLAAAAAAPATDAADAPGARGHADPGAVITSAGRRLMGVVGGASGALYGRALVRAGEAVTAAATAGAWAVPADAAGLEPAHTDGPWLADLALGAAIDAITGLGKAAPGDKTMLDALVPALAALRAHRGDAMARVRHAADVAEAGAEATIPLIARRGRASYLGERSAGHRDPGAASAAMLVRALARAYESA